MTILVTGRFSSPQGAEQALSRLIESGFLAADTDSFPIDTTSADPLSAAANDATDARVDQTIGSESIAGAIGGSGVGLAVGAASGIGATLLGPGGLLLGAALGAYVGSLAGALAGQSAALVGETLVAVRATGSAQQLSATELLRAAGALEIESVQGHLREGKWNFDPLSSAAAINA